MFFINTSYGSICSFAARSSTAHMVIAHICGWFGARQARSGPILVSTAVCFTRLFGNCQIYGRGGAPPDAGPPVPHDCESHATSVPSFLAATLTSAYIEGRAPATINS